MPSIVRPPVGTRPESAGLLDFALAYAARGWPVLATRPAGKAPLTPHGVRDATTDPDTIRGWFARWPDAGIGIATGAPGPTVLDVDDLAAAPRAVLMLDAPTVATARGRHLYFAGQPCGTVALGYGELRGQGAYVIAPPSTHPSGKAYVWTAQPNGRLPVVPAGLTPADVATAGSGEHRAPAGRVPHGQRHDHLVGVAVRLVRAGIVDERRILAHLWCEFEHFCEPLPAPKPGSLELLAMWAARTDIARRERRAP